MNANRTRHAEQRRGFAYGLMAYALWGVLPLYFKALTGVPPFDIVAHRVVWSLPFLVALILLARGLPRVGEAINRPPHCWHAVPQRPADRRQLATLRLCRDQRAHPRS